MIKKILASAIILLFVVGCAKQSADTEQMTAKGVMKHFPSDVKSPQAWQGHNFMVGNTPVIPTPDVSEDELLSHIGKSVVVIGTWYDGQQWQPNENEKNLPIPVSQENQIMIRGDGLKVSSISLINE